jgi:hypothetical protein
MTSIKNTARAETTVAASVTSRDYIGLDTFRLEFAK